MASLNNKLIKEAIFIEIWQDYNNQLKCARKNTHVYAEMADELKKRGLEVARPVDIKYKIENLKDKF